MEKTFFLICIHPLQSGVETFWLSARFFDWTLKNDGNLSFFQLNYENLIRNKLKKLLFDMRIQVCSNPIKIQVEHALREN